AIGQVVLRRQHQDRGCQIALAERPAYGDPVLARQEPVEHDHVVLVDGGLLLALLASRGDVDDEPFLTESPCEEPRGLAVVLDQEQAHRDSILANLGGSGTPEGEFRSASGFLQRSPRRVTAMIPGWSFRLAHSLIVLTLSMSLADFIEVQALSSDDLRKR